MSSSQKQERSWCIVTASNCICKDFHYHYSIICYCGIWCQWKSRSTETHLARLWDSLGNNKKLYCSIVYPIWQIANCKAHNCSCFKSCQLEMELHPERDRFTGYTANRKLQRSYQSFYKKGSIMILVHTADLIKILSLMWRFHFTRTTSSSCELLHRAKVTDEVFKKPKKAEIHKNRRGKNVDSWMQLNIFFIIWFGFRRSWNACVLEWWPTLLWMLLYCDLCCMKPWLTEHHIVDSVYSTKSQQEGTVVKVGAHYLKNWCLKTFCIQM